MQRSFTFIAPSLRTLAAFGACVTLAVACDGGSSNNSESGASSSESSGESADSSEGEEGTQADSGDNSETASSADETSDGTETTGGEGEEATHALDLTITWPGHTASMSFVDDMCPGNNTQLTWWDLIDTELLQSLIVGCSTGAGTGDLETASLTLFASSGGTKNQAYVGETGTFMFTGEPTRRLSVSAFDGPATSQVDDFQSDYLSNATGSLTIDVWDPVTRRVSGSVDATLTDYQDPTVVASVVGTFDFTYDDDPNF